MIEHDSGRDHHDDYDLSDDNVDDVVGDNGDGDGDFFIVMLVMIMIFLLTQLHII